MRGLLDTVTIGIMKVAILFGVLLGPLYIIEGLLHVLGW